MNVHVQPQFTALDRRLSFECVSLGLQGGGALEALAEAGIYPDWVKSSRGARLPLSEPGQSDWRNC
jgi:hypothetical protein